MAEPQLHDDENEPVDNGPLAGLPYSDRIRVGDAVLKGKAVDDARLRPYAVAYGEASLLGLESRLKRSWLAPFAAVLAVLWLALTVVAIIKGSYVVAVFTGFMTVLQAPTWYATRTAPLQSKQRILDVIAANRD